MNVTSEDPCWLEADLGAERRAASCQARVSRGLPATCPPKLDAAQQARLVRLYESGEPVSELMGMFKVSRATVLRVLRRARVGVPWWLRLVAAVVTLAAVLAGPPTAAAEEKVLLGGGAGIALDGKLCTLATIGNDAAGELVGFTDSHCGGPGAQVVGEGAEDHGTVGSVVATSDELDYAVIRFDAAKVAPIPDFDGFAINGIGPVPGLGQGVCEQSRATGHSCSYVTLPGAEGPSVIRVSGCRNPDDDGAPVTANDLLIGMVKDSGPFGGPPQICGFFVARTAFYFPPSPHIVSINAIMDDINAKGGPGAGFTPVPA